MARPVRIRLTYTGDRSRLSRLEEAVEKDTRIPVEKREKVLEHIRALASLFIDLDRSLPPVIPVELSKRRRPRESKAAS